MISFENFFGSVAFVTSVIGLLPQAYKAIKTRSTHDLSMLMLINYVICSLAWIIYAEYSDSLFVLLSNLLGLISSALLIVLKQYYDHPRVSLQR